MMISPELDYFELVKEAKRIDPGACRASVRVAILADCSTQHFTLALKALLYRDKVLCNVYEAPYDAVVQETHAADSPLYKFKPDVILILNTTAGLRQAYGAFEGSAYAFAQQCLGRLSAVWSALAAHSGAMIIQCNFPVPYDRIFGSYEMRAGASFPAAVASLNSLLGLAAKDAGRVLIQDLDYLSSYLGRRRWFDEKLWLLCKAPCSMDCIPYAARGTASMIQALSGVAIKCVVVDLDNTLWGGVIGDDGLDGIQLGELGDGKAYQDFQRYLLALKKRGVLLAICSRNDRAAALLPLRQHPDMILKEGDFAVIVANWENKADNIKAIQRTLNIGLDSILFLDDDLFERNLVRSALPEVVVPEMPADSADFVKNLCELGLFEAVTFSDEDQRRATIYAEESQRQALKSSFVDMNDYLKSLRMRAVIGRFDSFQLPRVAQLLSRSNQFNLTTRRYGIPECERFMADTKGCFPFYVSLKDNLGDSGLICAVVLLRKGDAVEINEWAMSCRVLLRGVEELTMNTIFEFARGAGAKRVVGLYRPTAKNALVKDLYGRFSFTRLVDCADGTVEWSLEVSRYADKTVFISREKEPTEA